MKFMHLADLHLGKTVNGHSMIEDQKFALNNIINLLKEENIKTLVIAGDIYQNSVPSFDAINIFDEFITECKKNNITILIISGNHDSSDRLAFASDILGDSKIYISKPYNGEIEKISLEDEYGVFNFFLFPYVKPQDVKKYYKDIDANSYSDAVKAVIDSIEIDEDERNVIISHQYILNADRSESEEIYAGEAEAVSSLLYDKFDYTALGHIHKKQHFLKGKVRYPGALLKYASSESCYDKTITIVDLKEKNNLEITERRIDYLRDMRIIRGMFEEIVKNSKGDTHKDDYIHIELLDEDDIFEGLSRLRNIYPNILTFRYINNRIGENNLELIKSYENAKNPLELFEEFYYQRLGIELPEEKKELMKESIDRIWGKNENN
ncbi:exonuclease SbcCD subunit D [Helcococcus kunzii]|uniref:exonuclease SbcCD subunit D n=1 Tax=Helcococcus kunzii TaxID=40091 RepID=UPI0021A7AFCF|nr:exonuclease SbcCD subunit D [Helcococcus kunzii]MCT1795969.1 exonuclease SbcCD subunit D [Helcococcus kunzii]MCT1988255.1 exonuclease SbcCD subunit D [Helcococcus kunzii]